MKHLLKLAAAGLLALTLAGCGGLIGTVWDGIQTVQNSVTNSPVQVTQKDVDLARLGFAAVEQTGTNYIVHCNKKPTSQLCSKEGVRLIVINVRAGRKARDALKAYVKAHPGGAVPQDLFSQLTAATATLTSIIKTYGADQI